jgi:hypothetical protein
MKRLIQLGLAALAFTGLASNVNMGGLSGRLLWLQAQMQKFQMRLQRLGNLPGGGKDHAVCFAAADRHQNRLDPTAIKRCCCAAASLVCNPRSPPCTCPLISI